MPINIIQKPYGRTWKTVYKFESTAEILDDADRRAVELLDATDTGRLVGVGTRYNHAGGSLLYRLNVCSPPLDSEQQPT